MQIDNYYIFSKEHNGIVIFNNNPFHPFYYWVRYIDFLLNTLQENDEFNNINTIVILLVTEIDIETPSFYKALAAFYKDQTEIKPLISIGNFDLNSIKEETYLPVDFLDSSIWNFYITVINDEANGQTTPFKGKLERILLTVNQHYKNKLYNTIVAKEFIEFQNRLLGNSYLGLPGGHAAAVVPFVFHSESKMKQKVSDKLEEIDVLTGNVSNKISWNILFIDDYSDKELRGGRKSKKVILKSLFCQIKGIYKKRYYLDFQITPCATIEEAKKEMAEKTFDIILLDYLLGQKSGTSNKREYGDEFLLKLKNNNNLLKDRGPLGKFWIFPVTSFNNAMLSKLEEEGIGRIDDVWYIMDGADMINTPELFKYNFLQLIYLQLNTAIVTIGDIARFIMENKTERKDTESDRSNSISDIDVYPIRQNARRLYGIFMHRFGLRGVLKYDDKQDSAFAQSVLEYMYEKRPEDLKFYESVRKLLYLVGYSTHADAALMWDLLTYIDSVVESNKFDDNKKIDKNEVKDFLKYIRRYISELKQ